MYSSDVGDEGEAKGDIEAAEDSVCKCINPFQGPPWMDGWKGTPEAMCGDNGQGFCYVDCKGAFNDKAATAGVTR